MIVDDAAMCGSQQANSIRRSPNCRVCDEKLRHVLDLGSHPRADAYRDPCDYMPELMFDLTVGICDSCHLVQLQNEVPPELMFNSSYPFRTSTSQGMQLHFHDTALALLKADVHTNTEPFIVEFGCNDGTFLAPFAKLGYDHLGIDPAANLIAEATSREIKAKTGWFNVDTATSILDVARPATVIYAANTLCHISDLAMVFKGVDKLLAKDGLFIFEDPYLGDIVSLGAFDQIYDEHIYYFSATSIDLVARKFGLILTNVEPLKTHGGQLRYTLARSHNKQSRAVADLIQQEQMNGLHSRQRLMNFAQTVRTRKDELVHALQELAGAGKSIAGYAATAKSATVLNYCGIGPDQLSVIYDTTLEKQGRLTPGTGIPIEPFPQRVEDYPDHFLLFAWNHAHEIASRETAFREHGGSWLRYVPGVTLTQSPTI